MRHPNFDPKRFETVLTRIVKSMPDEELMKCYAMVTGKQVYCDEKIFAEMQGERPWFDDSDRPEPQDLSDYKERQISRGLTRGETYMMFFGRIFGAYGIEKDLDIAESNIYIMYESLKNSKPSEQKRENEDYLRWQGDNGLINILHGTISAYKNEYVKAAYHFMIGIKTEMVGLGTPYVNFIRYILNKLSKIDKKVINLIGRGFEPNKPIGCYPALKANCLESTIAQNVIPELEGDDGGVIVAANIQTESFGYLKRKCSYGSTWLRPIDCYETYLIDNNYNLKIIHFYFNNYTVPTIGGQKIILPDGFDIKSHSILHKNFDFIKLNDRHKNHCLICNKITDDRDICTECLAILQSVYQK